MNVDKNSEEMSPEPRRFSRLPRLLKATAYMLRLIAKAFKKEPTSPLLLLAKRSSKKGQQIEIGELRTALTILIAQVQTCYPPSTKEWEELVLEEKDGVIRSNRRLQQAIVPYETKAPIYLPPKAELTRLIVYEEHLEFLYSGPTLTISHIRRRFWIPSARRVFKETITTKCMACRKFLAKPYRWPIYPSLPAERVREATPFRKVGIDYFGAFTVKSNGQIFKAYGIIFTCLVVRAVHFEIACDLSAEGFLDAFVRFTSRRGVPSYILSDNGTQFTLTAKLISPKHPEIEEATQWYQTIHSPEVMSRMRQLAIHWQFISERSPWRGGLYERIIQEAEKHLRRVLRPKKVLTPLKLYTLLTQIEVILNERPITYVSSDSRDPHPLTPSHFLHPTASFILPPMLSEEIDEAEDYTEGESSAEKLQNQWRVLELLLQAFWKAWVPQYLLDLRNSHRSLEQSKYGISRDPIVGEFVLINDGEDTPRGL